MSSSVQSVGEAAATSDGSDHLDIHHSSIHHGSFAVLAIGAIGVVFGDIGTSPLYAFREALNLAAEGGMQAEEIMGVLSLAIWSLILIVTVKYVLFLMRADNEGEGGVLALLALAGRGAGGRKGMILVLGCAGAALFYGDAVITPALSVLSAVEGIKTIPGMESGISQAEIILLTLAILVGLFAMQSRGTARVSMLFGPVCILWFLVIGAMGLIHVFDAPRILSAFSPHHAVLFLAQHGVTGLFVLGAVFLTVTGAEALTADMGHFGRAPIQAGWFALVLPALALNYLGQGAFALASLDAAEAAGKPFVNQDWFFLMAPDAMRGPLVVLALLATIIASQAVITGAYSLTRQAIQLGLLPRMRVRQTSASHSGQIYIAAINWLLLVVVVQLVLAFRTSSAMAAAYGIAVTGTMVITTCLAYMVVRHVWHWGRPLALAVIVPFLTIDLIFFGANVLRVTEGGWVPLVLAAMIGTAIGVWVRGKRFVSEVEAADAVAMDEFAQLLSQRPPRRVTGTAIYLTGNADVVPGALLHNLKHNKVLHERNLIATVKTVSTPYVDPAERTRLTRINEDFSRLVLRYGFMESPDIPRDVQAAFPCKAMDTSYFIGRNALRASPEEGLPYWQDQILIFLQRNAADPTDFFRIPPNRVVELGMQVTV